MSDRLGDKLRLQHIFDAINSIFKYTDGIDYESFIKNDMMIDASIRQLEIIGEAASKISNEIREFDDKIEWSKIIALRNLLIHEYFRVDVELVWDITQKEIPSFNNQLLNLVEKTKILEKA